MRLAQLSALPLFRYTKAFEGSGDMGHTLEEWWKPGCDSALIGGFMKYPWMARLTTGEPARFYSSLGCRRRAEAVAGRSAVMWAADVGHRMADYILENFDDWAGSRDEDEVESLRRATEASTIDTLAALATGDLEWTARSIEPVENAAFYAARNIPLDHVVRNIHVGQEFLTDAFLSAIDQLVPVDQRLATARGLTKDLASAWASLTQQVSERYTEERVRIDSSPTARVAEAVRAILSNDSPRPPSAAQDLGYALDQWHFACSIWLEHSDPETFRLFDFDRLAAEMTHLANTTGGTLIHNEGVRHLALWLGSDTIPDLKDLQASGHWPAALRITYGTPAWGIDGFRRSHREALAAEKVARVLQQPATLTPYAEVELLSILLSDPRQCAAFVQRSLGPELTATEAWPEELRKTLMTYMDHQGSLAATAGALHTHRNTVSYRLKKIRSVLPSGIPGYQVRCALEVVEKVPAILDRALTSA